MKVSLIATFLLLGTAPVLGQVDPGCDPKEEMCDGVAAALQRNKDNTSNLDSAVGATASFAQDGANGAAFVALNCGIFAIGCEGGAAALVIWPKLMHVGPVPRSSCDPEDEGCDGRINMAPLHSETDFRTPDAIELDNPLNGQAPALSCDPTREDCDGMIVQ